MGNVNIKAAIAATKNEDPSRMADAIANELDLRVVDALDDLKIAVADGMFNSEDDDEDYEDYEEDDEDVEEGVLVAPQRPQR